MDISPQTIRSTGFKTVKKGYDPDEVETFRNQVAAAVETAQNQSTAMEARARAAVAKLQELSQQVERPAREAPAAAHSGDTEVISRTLLLAQRTADAAVLEARTEAESITASAREEASRVLDGARAMAAKTIEDSRADARRAIDDDRVKAENEVQALLARRDFLLGDVDHLEQYLQAQRERLRDAAVQLQELVDRVPGGLGDMRRPLLSASAEPTHESRPAPMDTPVEAPVEVQAAIPEAEPEVASAGHDDGRSAAVDLDPSPLFAPRPAPHASLTAMALSSNADANDNVWRLLDEEVASTEAAQATQPALALDEVTAEVPAMPARPQPDPFRIRGEELE
jgi:DivIVA domain-containing protein